MAEKKRNRRGLSLRFLVVIRQHLCNHPKQASLIREMSFLSWCGVSDAIAENVAVIEVVVPHKKVVTFSLCKLMVVQCGMLV